MASIRTAVVTRIFELLKTRPSMVGADGELVQMTPGEPAGTTEREHVFVVLPVRGEREIVFMEAGRKTIEDNFTIPFLFQSAVPGSTLEECSARVEAMSNDLLDVLADDPTLGELDGLMWATEATTEGPDAFQTDEGAVAFWRTDVECKARYE